MVKQLVDSRICPAAANGQQQIPQAGYEARRLNVFQ